MHNGLAATTLLPRRLQGNVTLRFGEGSSECFDKCLFESDPSLRALIALARCAIDREQGGTPALAIVEVERRAPLDRADFAVAVPRSRPPGPNGGDRST